MQKLEHSIILDLLRGGVQDSIEVKKGEVGSRRIIACLVNGSRPYYPDENITVQLRALKPDGTELYNGAVIDGAVATIDITSQIVSAAGTVECQLSFTDEENNLLFSPRFDIIVEECLYSDSAIESTNEYSVLTEAITSIGALETKWSTATATAQSGKSAAAEVTVTGEGVSFDFTLPKGEKGDAGVSVSVGTTETGEAGTQVSVTNSGTASDAVLNFIIPRGAQGIQGVQGIKGEKGERGEQGIQGKKGDPGKVQSVDGIVADENGNVLLGAANGAIYSTNATGAASESSFAKGFDVLTDASGNIKGFGIGKAANAGSMDIAGSLALPMRNALGASSGIWPVSLGGTGADSAGGALTNLDIAPVPVPISLETWMNTSTFTNASYRVGNIITILLGFSLSASVPTMTTIFHLPFVPQGRVFTSYFKTGSHAGFDYVGTGAAFNFSHEDQPVMWCSETMDATHTELVNNVETTIPYYYVFSFSYIRA